MLYGVAIDFYRLYRDQPGRPCGHMIDQDEVAEVGDLACRRLCCGNVFSLIRGRILQSTYVTCCRPARYPALGV